MLVPNPTNTVAAEASRMYVVLLAAAARGVSLRLMISANAASTTAGATFCAYFATVPGSCVVDTRHASSGTGNNHAKAWTVQTGAELVAWVGSMDVAQPRWDTTDHDIRSPEWQSQPHNDALGRLLPWHGLRGAQSLVATGGLSCREDIQLQLRARLCVCVGRVGARQGRVGSRRHSTRDSSVSQAK